jgi:hypothetical protein
MCERELPDSVVTEQYPVTRPQKREDNPALQVGSLILSVRLGEGALVLALFRSHSVAVIHGVPNSKEHEGLNLSTYLQRAEQWEPFGFEDRPYKRVPQAHALMSGVGLPRRRNEAQREVGAVTRNESTESN